MVSAKAGNSRAGNCHPLLAPWRMVPFVLKLNQCLMGKRKSGPFSGQQIASNTSKSNFSTFFIIKRVSTSDETFHSASPFLVEKAITGSIGDVKSTKKLLSGVLLVEVQSRKESEEIVKLKNFPIFP
ncbi:hypothetical protein AVEN_153951-1 [Araneus ventricosus]|uniref:Uncharacterized protein n=1 Tax=Araneus ventricosus TaxID=182803 RepID=A0A4Y2S6P1_ARAVE|nr:hypothetical protein AVEN_153951-1 [Araneus ventricosus]